ncbi:unnamed protein product [Rhodiola kirilowii]
MLNSEFNLETQMRSLANRLRPLVGSNGWDYCVVWRLNEDHRVLEWLDSCCAGADMYNLDKQDELMFPVSSSYSCRDVMFSHQRTASCNFLSQLPSSLSLDDSGVYSQVMYSNHPQWFNFLNSPNPENAPEVSITPKWVELMHWKWNINWLSLIQETVATRVLVPVPGGLVELFVAKQVFEDHQVVDFVIGQCSNNVEHQAFLDPSLQTSIHEAHENGYDMEAMIVNDVQTLPGEPSVEHSKEVNEKDSVKPEIGRSDSISDCSDQIDDDEDDASCRKRNGKKPQAKNLEAERRRRKKLNERLYNLRSLVPIISKLDKASILVDAITYLKDLKKQEKELQDELEELSTNEGVIMNNDATNIHATVDFVSYPDDQNAPNNLIFGALDTMHPLITRTRETTIENDKVQQMEPQVEVTQIDANKFFIKVFCEHKPGGLVRLLEALSSLGLDVTNVNVTSCRMLVSNIFEVELKRDSEVVADDLKNSLLELTRIPFGSGWQHDQLANKPENGIDDVYHCHHGLLNHHANSYHLQN